nr:RraA family protein [Oricola nitratireducens]
MFDQARGEIVLDTTLIAELANLTTPHLADGCLVTGNPIRIAPAGLRPLVDGMTCYGRAAPVQHLGSIDIFFEAIEQLREGEVIVIDNGGRLDEACIGDIVLLEAQDAGAAGFVVWGCHRDSKELAEIGFPVFSFGALPTGPQRSSIRPDDVLSRASFGRNNVTRSDFVVADANGVLFIADDKIEEVIHAAIKYRDTEASQLSAMRSGVSYRTQTKFADYLEKRKSTPSYGFRQHLKAIAAAGEV